MNASARRENLLACLDCALPEPTRLPAHSTRRLPSALGWMLLTGLACSGADATLAAELAAAATTSAAPTPAATAPLAPLPPSLPAAATAAKPVAATPVKENAPAEDKAKASTTWQTITGWISPPTATAKTPPKSTELNSPAARLTAGAVPGSSPARTLSMSMSPSTTTVGRFDPEFGPAGHVASDTDEQSFQTEPMPRVAPPRQFLTPVPEQQTEQSAVASDEPVSLVSWLSSYASGGYGQSGHADACRDVCLTDNCCPTWEAQVDALFLWQGNIPSRPLYTDSVSEATVLDANQLYAPAAIAPRYALTYHRDDCRAIEVNYFQVWGFNAQQVVGPLAVGGDGAFTANNLVGPSYNTVSGALATSSANIQSLEVNLRRTDGGMIEWISGFRWLEWGQNLSLLDSITQGDFLVGGDYASINTLNSLYGWQWGGDMMLWNAGRWLRVNGIAKAGVYYNHQAAQNTFYTDFVDPTADVSVASANDTVSFVGETGINASLALTNWLSWRAGYTCFWLGGVAVPARQLGLYDVTAGTTSINTNGSVFLHGVTTGLEARW